MCYIRAIIKQSTNVSGADPGFLIGGGTNPPGGGTNIQICQIFPKKCMKLRKFWSVGGHMLGAPPLDQPSFVIFFCNITLVNNFLISEICLKNEKKKSHRPPL